MKKLITVVAVFASILLSPLASLAATYDIDVTHSSMGFAVKHLQVSTVKGSFNDFTGTIAYDPADLSTFNAQVTIQVTSIDTSVEARDNHLRSSDFFDAPIHPAITFVSNRLEKRGEGTVLVGDLTIRGVTKTITIPVIISGPVQSPSGGEVIGISGQTFINRQDFGVSWSKQLDNGGLVVEDTVNLIIEIEAAKKS